MDFMSFFTLDQNVIIGIAIGVAVGTILTKMIFFKTKQTILSWTGFFLADLVLAYVIYYFRAKIASYFKITNFIPIFIIFVLLYVAFYIWFFELQNEEKVTKNRPYFMILTLLFLGLVIFFFMNDLITNFSLPENYLFLGMVLSFLGAFLIYYTQIFNKKTTGVIAHDP